MVCHHPIVFRAANNRHRCRDCGTHVIVTRHGPGPAYRSAAVQRLVEASTAFVEITRGRNSDLYVHAFAELATAAETLERADDAVPGRVPSSRGMRRDGTKAS